MSAIALKVIGILVLVMVVNRIALRSLRRLAARWPFVQAAGGILRGFVRGVVYGLGGLILMDTLGVSITPLLASLGIGSLAVALALQDTLANLFAGIDILADRPIRVGDFIRLESGQEGYVLQIGWRSTRIRMLSNNIVVVPNTKVVNSTLINYDLPEPELAVLVEVGVQYGSDLAQVERVTTEVARRILKTVPGGVATFEPFIRYHTFGESSVNFTVILRGREFADQYLLKHEFIKALEARYRQEGIVIPIALRVLDVSPAPRGS